MVKFNKKKARGNARKMRSGVAKAAAKKPASSQSHRKAQMKQIRKPMTAVKIKASLAKVEKPARSTLDNKPKEPKRKENNAHVFPPEEVKRAVDEIATNEAVSGYLKKNISKRALDVLSLLVSPKTDESLALELDMKINAVRRILNLMQGIGITNYYISKNVNGWLSFAWYINVSKLKPFYDYVESMESKKSAVSDECNDYFVCNNCFEQNKLIFTFDAAFEEGFKCVSCTKGLTQINKTDATRLVERERTSAEQKTQPVAGSQQV